MSVKTQRIESFARLFFGFLLWAVSASLTMVLLVSLGDGSAFESIVLAVVAVGLEGAKILTWRKGRATRVYAIALICLSGIASIGASLRVVQSAQGMIAVRSREEIEASAEYKARDAEIASIDSEVGALLEKIKSLPENYVSATTKLEESVHGLRDRKALLLSQMEAGTGVGSVGSAQNDGNIILALSTATGIRSEVILLVLLLFVSAAIEVGALILTVSETVSSLQEGPHADAPAAPIGDDFPLFPASSHGRTLGRMTRIRHVSAEEFLEAAEDEACYPYLRGRDATAEKLGISYGEAKRHVATLISQGRISVEGKRLVRLQDERLF